MPELAFFFDPLSILSIVACVVFAVIVWVRLNSINKPSQPGSDPRTNRTEEASMHVGDWVNAAINIFFGVLLGVVIKGLVDLTSTHFWTVAVVILLGAVTLEFFDKVLGKVFPGGIRSARKSQNGRAPLPRRLSLPAGLAIGFILAHLGLGSAVIGWIA